MSLELAQRQLHRLTALHSSASVLPGGRVLTSAEGKALAHKALGANNHESDEVIGSDVFGLTSDEGTVAAAARAAHNSRSTVLLENDVSRKIVTLRQKQHKKQNIQHALEKIEKDRLPEKLLKTELPKVRRVAEQIYNKKPQDKQAAQQARRERLGEEKKKK
eukprot:GILI01030018.1.p1 GENE.GILI01030018.1~~GILI01030018.1.p1  ORF type:complete len:183 (+),score=28.05 GILI01030018.1:64-549(+)